MISVCLATHNGEKFISEQLKSILPQLDEHDEVIISDDNSTDRTLHIVRSFDDERIIVLGPNFFSNPVKNFEHALNHVKGDVVFLSDQDDIWHADKVKSMMEQFNRGYDLVVSDCTIVDNDMNVLVPSYFDVHNSGEGFIKNLVRNGFMGCCMAFKRPILSDALPFPENLPMHDVWIGLIAEASYKVLFFKKQTLFYRQHANNASATAEGVSSYSLSQKLMFRTRLIKHLVKRLILKNG